MSGFELALLCGVIVAAIVSYNNTRALLWLALGTANYVLTSTYAALDWPLHPFATAMTDAAMCITIYLVCKRYGGQVWELGVYTAFWLSVGVGFLSISGYLDAGNAALYMACGGIAYILCLRHGGEWLKNCAHALFWISAGLGFVYVFSHAESRNASVTLYPLLLEVCNWLAILSVFTSGTLRLADAWIPDLGGFGLNRGRLHRLVSAVYAPAKIAPSWIYKGWFPPIPS